MNTPESPTLSPPPASRSAGTPRSRHTRRPAGAIGWLAALALVIFSVALVLWAKTRPSYDAYGWLVWAYQTLHLNLDLGGAPSWKPLTFVFTLPFALFGTHAELWLWMFTAVALALAGAVFGGRIAFWVLTTGRERAAGVERSRGAQAAAHSRGMEAAARSRGAVAEPEPIGALERWAPWLAAVFAGASVLALQDYFHYILSVQSDPVIVTFTLAGIDAYLRGRLRLAFWLGLMAGLGRPEAWCLLGPYTLYLWLRVPSLRRMVVVGWALILFMWFGVPTITNDRPFVSAQLAEGSPRQLHGDLFTGTLHRFWDLYNVPLWIAAFATLAWAAFRRDRLVLILGGCGVLWVITEIAFAYKGWPAIPRYMFEGAAILGVVAGIGFGWLLMTPLMASGRLLRYGGPVLAAALVIALLPYARIRYEQEHDDLTAQRARTGTVNSLVTVIERLGGPAKIRYCGQPSVDVQWASMLAFDVRIDVGFIGYRPKHEIISGHKPLVVFTALPDFGWEVRTFHTAVAKRAACRPLRSELLFTPAQPRGVMHRLPL